MKLILNGEPKELPALRTVADLVRHLGLAAAPCAVEVNRALVSKPAHESHELHEGDSVEVVTLVGGG